MTRADELHAVAQQFFSETRHAFAFLERAYGYRHVGEALDTHPVGITGERHYVRAAESHYVRARVGVGIHLEAWIPDATVSFVALPQPDVYRSGGYFPEAYPEWPRAIELISLAHMLGHQDDPDFLLPPLPHHLDYPETPEMPETPETPTSNMEPPLWLTAHLAVEERRVQLLKANLPGVLAGLARATQKYAATILEGDTSMFPAVQDYVAAEFRRRYPHYPPRRSRPNR